MNLIGPELVRDLVGLLDAMESDPDVEVMVLDPGHLPRAGPCRAEPGQSSVVKGVE
jgi:hypothetical protein